MRAIKKVLSLGGNWSTTIAMLLIGLLVSSAYLKHILTDQEFIYAFQSMSEKEQRIGSTTFFLLLATASLTPLLSIMGAMKLTSFLERYGKKRNKGVSQ